MRINGIDALALTKLDVLDGLETIDICTGYEVGDREVTEFPADLGHRGDVQAGLRDVARLDGADQGA